MPGSAPFDATDFDTAIGRCAVAWHGDTVVRFLLPGPDPQSTPLPDNARRIPAPEAGPRAAVLTRIRAHLDGDLDDLRWIPLDLTGLPQFHRAVYTVTRAIDPGRTLSYGEVADRIGTPGAAQAVGRALGRNPIPLIIPCHRVLAADHALHGFSAPGGTATKQRLLAIERTSGFGEPTLF
ncbi:MULTISPECIES: methylated-DNA--[protein]-cysteine S-methyltransferase [Nocardia]|uniref:methylated-DNA--[protein]-cysteine S-methyltransferase n=1 Tax=Nocardia TaxID=1817 RepID=UPI001894838C|nr:MULTISPECIES: methylated-DNA--[protein]-cysteine S-methyltransferase [Nocardia]MBF6352475.1 methylated-DNA--[protein]-cysteine S-methyltransferase [Nocardia flavorosea]